MFLKINVNEDVEFVLRKISKKHNKDMAIIAAELLSKYVEKMDEEDFERSEQKLKREKMIFG